MVPSEQLTMRMIDLCSPYGNALAMLTLHMVVCAHQEIHVCVHMCIATRSSPHHEIVGPKLMAANQKVDMRV